MATVPGSFQVTQPLLEYDDVVKDLQSPQEFLYFSEEWLLDPDVPAHLPLEPPAQGLAPPFDAVVDVPTQDHLYPGLHQSQVILPSNAETLFGAPEIPHIPFEPQSRSGKIFQGRSHLEIPSFGPAIPWTPASSLSTTSSQSAAPTHDIPPASSSSTSLPPVVLKTFTVLSRLFQNSDIAYATCRWGKCGHRISTVETAITRHLEQAHGVTGQPKKPVRCQWSSCENTIQRSGLARHLTKDDHLGSSTGKCKLCGKAMARQGSLKTHLKKCKVAVEPEALLSKLEELGYALEKGRTSLPLP